LAGTSQTVWQGAYLLAIYSLGLGVPFLVLGVAFDFIMPLLKNIRNILIGFTSSAVCTHCRGHPHSDQ